MSHHTCMRRGLKSLCSQGSRADRHPAAAVLLRTLDEFMDEIDRLRAAVIEGRALMRRVSAWLNDSLAVGHASPSWDQFNLDPHEGQSDIGRNQTTSLDPELDVERQYGDPLVLADTTRAAPSGYVRPGQAARTNQLPPVAAVDDRVEPIKGSLLHQYTEMYQRAIHWRRSDLLIEQAREQLGDNLDKDAALDPETGDGHYVQYVATRSTPIGGGEPDLHRAVSLDRYNYEAAAARCRRDFAEMIVINGKIRTAGAPLIEEYANPVMLAALRIAPAGYQSPGQAVRDAQDQAGEEGQDMGVVGVGR